MKFSKKIIISTLFITLLIGGIYINKDLSAASLVSTSDNNRAKFNIETEEIDYAYGLKHSTIYGTTSTTALGSTGSQHINEFEMKTDGVNSKLVSWCMQSSMLGYVRTGLSKIAKNYEETHPGWIVVAGINGDQYFQYYGNDLFASGQFYFVPQPYYPLIMDGERRFPITATGVSSSAFVGLSNDGSTSSFISPGALDSLKIEILDENGKVIYISNVNGVNVSPTETNKTSIWLSYLSNESSSKYVTMDVKSENDIYKVEKAELVYMNNNHNYDVGGKVDSLFARGKITEVVNEYTTEAKGFAIETLDEALKTKLNIGTRIRVQYYYQSDALNKVESCFNYHSIQRINNTDVEASGSYDTQRYNRSIFGKKDDGTYVLLTVDKDNYAGTTHDESNAILKYFGVTEAYQQDGGGSVTAIIRNSSGTFDLVNDSSDGKNTERSILMGCLFVVRDPGYYLYPKDIERNQVTFTRKDINTDIISNVKATINDTTYNLDDSLTIDNLEGETPYSLTLSYDVKVNGKTAKGSNIYNFTTKGFTIPKAGVSVDKKEGTYIKLIHENNYYDNYIKVEASLNGKTFDITSNLDTCIFDNLDIDTTYNIDINYTVYDEIDGKEYTNHEVLEVKTEKYDIPYIKNFNVLVENNNIKCIYDIYDPSNLVNEIYVQYIGNETDASWADDVTSDNGEIIFNNLNNGDYKIELVVKYETKDTYTLQTKEDISINYTIKEEPKKNKCSKKSLIYILSLINIVSVVAILINKKH